MFPALGKQLRRPSGFFGRFVARIMEFRNGNSYRKIIQQLDLTGGDVILEIGYGPGVGINLIATGHPDCLIDGIDFSELMYEKAQRKNKKWIDRGNIHLSCGDLLIDSLETGKYDRVFCLNVIYFWNDLNLAFTKVHSLLKPGGTFLMYMDHKDYIEKVKFTADFCKYSIEEVEQELKKAGFAQVDYLLDTGYFIKARR
jgi:SAM-dependent methyltransferase